MPQILWIGCLENDDEFKEKAKKGYDLASAQVSQKNLVEGLEKASGLIFDSINGSVLPPYPVYRERKIKPVVWSHAIGAYDISVGYMNDKYINRVNCKNAMLAEAKAWIKKRYKGEELVVFVYSMRSAPMATACYIKRRIPNAKIYLIITDLPQYMDLGQSKIKALLKKIDWSSIKKMQNIFDGFILYAAKMAEFLEIPDGKWILMEGSFDTAEVSTSIAYSDSKAIMYSGKLDEKYGIPLLLDSFMKLPDKDAELWITGGGSAEQYVKLCAKKDSRIKFYGFLPSRKDVLDLQQKAALLVNMRLPSEPASNYCFPSKLFEYMATGVPVLTFKLGGIPKEYYSYLIMTDEDHLLDDLQKYFVMDKLHRKEIGERAKEFISTKKTKDAQSKKIWEFITHG